MNDVILEISNQRSYYYIRIDDLRNIGFVWQKLSTKGYFKFFGFYRFNCEAAKNLINSDVYFDSLDNFLNS